MLEIRRTEAKSAKEAWYRKDVLVIDPNTKLFHVYPLSNAWVTDEYSADSLAGLIGFMDEESIIYVADMGLPA
ncbi:hypothetical protein [Ferviditalea candida]|uniref:Uncharacterized protein n=1 Tax=Ferviditalea candida TaxID=3108399 RepID=A0ABU5ZCX0_9BACL|nr:hypothetical protein [Paenibacillaceae bacterium T2]